MKDFVEHCGLGDNDIAPSAIGSYRNVLDLTLVVALLPQHNGIYAVLLLSILLTLTLNFLHTPMERRLGLEMTDAVELMPDVSVRLLDHVTESQDR
jgi:hypothetical protein